MKFPTAAVLTTFLLVLLSYSCETNSQTNSADNSDSKKEHMNGAGDTPESGMQKEPTSALVAEEDQKPSLVRGIDISKFQGDEIDFLYKQKDSLSFVICKATEGITYTDPKFKNNWLKISEKGFIKGVYHFYRSNDAPAAQAANYINAIGDLKSEDLPPMVDFEGGGIDKSQSITSIQTDLKTFLNKIEEGLNRKPMIYTNPSVGNKYLNDEMFSEYDLWVADYNGKQTPDLPILWKDKGWKFWQKNSSYEIENTKNDFDVFNGDHSELLNFIAAY